MTDGRDLPFTRRSTLQWLVGAYFCAARGARPAWAQSGKIRPDASCVLLVVDVQNCFVAGGSLAVKQGAAVVPIINGLAPAFANVVLTQDWHTPGHASFASSHPGKKPYQAIHLAYGEQMLWPDHCIQGTHDAQLASGLRVPQAELIIRKGFHRDVDSYSAFQEADRKTPTGLTGYLKQREIHTVFITGLATDFCVAWTALDARRAGFAAYVIEDACRGIDINGSVDAAWLTMQKNGVRRIQSRDIEREGRLSLLQNAPSPGLKTSSTNSKRPQRVP